MKCLTSQVCKLCNMNFTGAFHRACTSSTWTSLSMLLGSAYIYLFLSFIVVGFHTCLPEKLLSKQSRACPAEDESTCNGAPDSAKPSPAPADPGPVAELRKQIEELTSQNSELALKVQVNSGKISYNHTSYLHNIPENYTHTQRVMGLYNEE